MALPRFVKLVNGQPAIEIGAMRHQITIQSYAPTSPPSYNDAGLVYAWTTFASGVQAAIGAQASGAEAMGRDVQKDGQVVSQLPVSVAMWACAADGIQPKMRVTTERGNTYVIQSIEDVLEMGVVVILQCVAISDL